MQSVTTGEILNLSIPERIQLGENIWDSIAARQKAVKITQKKEELELRLADYAPPAR